jgi:phosphoribosyl 1,2-cyclic phosphodiesterase
MPVELCVLASGSSANCVYLATPTTRILIDAGLSGKATAERLDSIGVDINQIDAICITHEHDDHKAGLGVLQRRHQMALYANSNTARSIMASPKQGKLEWTIFHTGAPFPLGDLAVHPFSVMHDGADPVGFVFTHAGSSIGVVTDMGMVTELVRQRLAPCHTVVLESNHDEQLLKDSGRPWSLKQRIAGTRGHLSNKHAAELACAIAPTGLKRIFLAHISNDCNERDLAMRTMKHALEHDGHSHVDVHLTYQSQPTELVVIPTPDP